MNMTATLPAKKSLISIVDDEACVRESLSSLIRSAGYRTEEFGSAEGFLMDGKWDETVCLILDIRLPGMGGLELQRRLADMGRDHPPIIFVSGHATDKDRAWALRMGTVAFLNKPFSDKSLLDAVKESISRTSTPEETPTEYNFMGDSEKQFVGAARNDRKE
jgi:FixJ family two-component response regulator